MKENSGFSLVTGMSSVQAKTHNNFVWFSHKSAWRPGLISDIFHSNLSDNLTHTFTRFCSSLFTLLVICTAHVIVNYLVSFGTLREADIR